MTESALEVVGRVQSLRVLSLNAISVSDLTALASLSDLRYLMICGAPRLESVAGLESLGLLGAYFDDDGFLSAQTENGKILRGAFGVG